VVGVEVPDRAEAMVTAAHEHDLDVVVVGSL
jgi:hypothetical protein